MNTKMDITYFYIFILLIEILHILYPTGLDRPSLLCGQKYL